MITSFRARPPRFFSELKGKTCRIVEFDLIRSKFIPNCHEDSTEQNHYQAKAKQKNGGGVRVPSLPKKELPSL